jgi:rod shape-determining protein MreD
MRITAKYIVRFILLVLVQVLILNNVKFLGFINPYLYILFIITLPISTPRVFLLLIAFVLGLSIDIFSNTPGVHAFATVFAAFMKAPLIRLFAPRDSYDYVEPSMQTFGMNQFVKYAVLMVFIHQIALFAVEAFSFQNVGLLILKILLNSIFTLLLLLSIERFKLK